MAKAGGPYEQLGAACKAVGLRPIQKSILLAWPYWADETGLAWPSVCTLCNATGFQERAVRGALCALEELGILKVVANRYGGRKGESAKRRLDLARLREFAEGDTVAPETGAPDAPVPNSTGTSCRQPLHPVPKRGAPDAPKPPINLQRTHHHGVFARGKEQPNSRKAEPPRMKLMLAMLKAAGICPTKRLTLLRIPNLTPERLEAAVTAIGETDSDTLFRELLARLTAAPPGAADSEGEPLH